MRACVLLSRQLLTEPAAAHTFSKQEKQVKGTAAGATAGFRF
jgi:hypothetical protein